MQGIMSHFIVICKVRGLPQCLEFDKYSVVPRIVGTWGLHP